MITDRQNDIRRMIPRFKGIVRREFSELDRKLSWYAYSEQELGIIEKEVVSFVAEQEKKRLAKIAKRAAIKEAKLRVNKS